MRNKILLFLVFILCFNTAHSQLYVSNNVNSFVYVKNEVLTVTDYINLPGVNSMIYLRDGSKLIQKYLGVSSNVGLGGVSVFQEGTATHQYDYDSWCMLVGNQNVVVGNTLINNIATLFYAPSVNNGKIISVPATILPLGVLDGSATNGVLNIAGRWMWKYLSSTSYSQWSQVGAGQSIVPGEGFTMEGTSGSDVIIPNLSATLSNGVYVVRIKNENGDLVRKIII